MIRDTTLQHRFVDTFPDQLERGVLYISLEYGSASHSCCCGCGEEVVTPLTPTDWSITYDGETVTVRPSVGSWTLACRSHYVIHRGRVFEALPWTDAEIAIERDRDRKAKSLYFAEGADPAPTSLFDVDLDAADTPESPIESSWHLHDWWKGR